MLQPLIKCTLKNWAPPGTSSNVAGHCLVQAGKAQTHRDRWLAGIITGRDSVLCCQCYHCGCFSVMRKYHKFLSGRFSLINYGPQIGGSVPSTSKYGPTWINLDPFEQNKYNPSWILVNILLFAVLLFNHIITSSLCITGKDPHIFKRTIILNWLSGRHRDVGFCFSLQAHTVLHWL